MGNRQRQNWKTFLGLASTALFMLPGAGFGATFLKSLAVGATNILVNFLLPMLPGKEDSPSYSWKHEPNSVANSDIPMPIVYGKTRVKPVIKSRHIRMKGTKQYLDVLYSFTGHKVDERVVRPWEEREPGKPWEVDDEVSDPLYPGRTYICVKSHSTADKSFLYNTKYWKLGHGTAWNAGISDIILDGNPIESYVTATPDIFNFETRAGTASQSYIAGFETSYDNYPQGVVINTPEPTISFNTASIFLKELETGGHQYWIEWEGHDLLYLGSYFKIEKGKTTWAIFPGVSSNTPLCVLWTLGASKYTLRSIKPTEIPEGYHLVTYFTRLIPEPSTKQYIIDNFKTSAIVLSNVHNIELIFDFPRGLYSFDWNDQETENDTAIIKAKYREKDKIPEDSWHPFEEILNWEETGIKTTYDLENGLSISADKTDNFSVSWSAKNEGEYLDPDKNYEVQYEAISAHIVEIANIAGVTYSLPDSDGEYRPHTYPGECLVGIKALATGYLQGGFEVTGVVERSTVKVYDPDYGWSDKDANCHAWAVYDILVNGYINHPEYPNITNDAETILPVYGCGVNPDRIDYDSFVEWVAYTYTNLKYRLNTVFDTKMTAWDAVIRICEEGQAALIPIGSEFRALTDRPVLESEINSLFCMGNINEGTFKQEWFDISKKARSIDVSFSNEERSYDKTNFTVRSDDFDTSEEQDNPLSITLYGTTNYPQAFAISKYRLNCNSLLSQMCSFETDVEAINLDVGDVIPIQHDMLCGEGGRILDVTYNLLKNPSFEDTTISPWQRWSLPSIWGKSVGQVKYGTYSIHTRSTSDNGGVLQTFTVKPNTTYTLSSWVYMLNVYTTTATIRAMTHVTGLAYSKALADKTKLNEWQQVSVTFTTAEAQTTAAVWLGGIGEAYFDGVMVTPGTTIPDFLTGTKLTLDKSVTAVAGNKYELQLACSNGELEEKSGMTSGNVSSDGTILTFGDGWTWTNYPERYDPYAFGLKDAAVKLFRIMSISSNSDYKFEISAMEYDANVYKINPSDETSEAWTYEGAQKVAPDLNEPIISPFNRVSSIVLNEIVSKNRTTGEYESSINVKFVPENGKLSGEWIVSWRDVTANDAKIEGVWTDDKTEGYNINDVVESDGVIYISAENGNKSTPFLID